MFDRNLTLSKADPDVWAAVQKEDVRQEQHIELIASENYASPPSWKPRARSSRTSTPKATPASATTAAANTWTWSSSWPSIA